jgi:hypothetical protein
MDISSSSLFFQTPSFVGDLQGHPPRNASSQRVKEKEKKDAADSKKCFNPQSEKPPILQANLLIQGKGNLASATLNVFESTVLFIFRLGMQEPQQRNFLFLVSLSTMTLSTDADWATEG